MSQSKEERLFTLTCALLAAGQNGLTKDQILQSVQGYVDSKPGAALDKLFERDKQILRDSGVALEVLGQDDFSETPDEPRYRIPKGAFSWPDGFELNPNKLQLLELATKAWNKQALSTPAQQGLTRLKALGLVAIESQPEVFSPRLLARHSAFAPLAEGIANLQLVRFDYKKPGEEISPRLIQPWKLRQLDGQWILLGKEVTSGEPKNFLLRRIYSRVELLEQNFAQPSVDLIAKAEKDLEEFIAKNTAILEIPEDSAALSFFGIEKSKDGRVEIRFMDEDLLAEDLREFGVEVKVVEPLSLAARVKKGFEEVIQYHAQS